MSCLCRSQMGHERTTDVQVCSSPLENDTSSILPSGEVEWEEHREEADALNSCKLQCHQLQVVKQVLLRIYMGHSMLEQKEVFCLCYFINSPCRQDMHKP